MTFSLFSIHFEFSFYYEITSGYPKFPLIQLSLHKQSPPTHSATVDWHYLFMNCWKIDVQPAVLCSRLAKVHQTPGMLLAARKPVSQSADETWTLEQEIACETLLLGAYRHLTPWHRVALRFSREFSACGSISLFCVENFAPNFVSLRKICPKLWAFKFHTI